VAVGDRGEIVVDDHLMTTAPGVLAVGDVTGTAQLTHLADEMGRLAVRNAFARRGRRLSLSALPWVTFTDPEVARVGVTEAEAGRRARVAELAMDEVDRAIAEGRTEGFVRLVAAPRPLVGWLGGGRLVGATIVAPRAGEMVHEAVLAIRTGMFAGRIAQAVHAYPTWSTAVRQAAAQLVSAGSRPPARAPRR
jgi:pyruvate/2-oxoglutarate dehydrogenase complex dihydrolipoamide dehydrogenase (E3) component